jgi:hypothetical protein
MEKKNMEPIDGEKLNRLLDALGHDEEPLGMYYTDVEPQRGFAPSPGALPSVEQEARNEVDWKGVWENFSCVFAHLWLARKKQCPAYFSTERFGCLGCAFFLGFMKPQLDFIVHYVSTGIPGIIEGERYLDSPELTRKFYDFMDPEPAPGKFCVFQPISQIEPPIRAEFTVFFARPEVISALHQLATFVTGDFEAVASPFGAGCANIVTWPIRYRAQGRLKAVLGGWDPSDRRFLKTDEITLTLPQEMFQQMLDRWEQSFLTTETWKNIRKKVLRSQKAWGEAKDA